MSSNAADPPTPPPEWDRLELSVRRLLDAHDAWRVRARTAEARVKELEASLADVASGRVDPVTLADEVEKERRRNRDLNDRLEKARTTVERVLARLQFLEENR